MALRSQRPVCGMVAEDAATTVDATLYTNLTFWINGGATGGQTYFGQRRVERLEFGTSFSFSDGADELMEASHHFSRHARRQQDQPDRYFDLTTALRPNPSSLMICG